MDLINELREILARFFVFYCNVVETCFAPQLSAANPISSSIAKPAINDEIQLVLKSYPGCKTLWAFFFPSPTHLCYALITKNYL